METIFNFQLRPPTEADIPAITKLRNCWWQAISGNNITTGDEVRAEWNEPGSDPQHDSCVAVNDTQQIVGEASLHSRSPYVLYYLSAHVHPDWQMRGIGSALTAWLEATVQARFPSAPASERIVISNNILSTQEAARQLLLEHGYAMARNFHEMDIVMDTPPPMPLFPAGITLRGFLPEQDKEAAYQANQDAFHDHFGYVPVPFEEGAAIVESVWRKQWKKVPDRSLVEYVECNLQYRDYRQGRLHIETSDLMLEAKRRLSKRRAMYE